MPRQPSARRIGLDVLPARSRSRSRRELELRELQGTNAFWAEPRDLDLSELAKPPPPQNPYLAGGGGQQLNHYPYGGERMVSPEQTPRKGVIWSRMTASAVAIGARLKGFRRSRGELGSVRRAPLLWSGRCSYMRRRPSRRLHRCAAELLMVNTSG